MNKLFGIFSNKIIEKENIYKIKDKIIKNGFNNNIYLSKDTKIILFNKKYILKEHLRIYCPDIQLVHQNMISVFQYENG